MPEFMFNKLIRDKILALHLAESHDVKYTRLKGEELKAQLLQKLHEKVDEVPVSQEKTADVIEEMADVQQVINDLKKQYMIEDEELEGALRNKLDKKGGFEEGIFVESVSLPEDDEWTSYYRNAPEKYPEYTADDSLSIPDLEPGIYEHYKGKRYEVVGVALHSETLEPMVVYRPLYETRASLWVRPYTMFMENVEINGEAIPRFRKIDHK